MHLYGLFREHKAPISDRHSNGTQHSISLTREAVSGKLRFEERQAPSDEATLTPQRPMPMITLVVYFGTGLPIVY